MGIPQLNVATDEAIAHAPASRQNVQPLCGPPHVVHKAMSSLFATTIATEHLAPEYVAIRDAPRHTSLRAELEQQWLRYRSYADPNFRDQLQRREHFQSRVWEMRLACAFLEAGLEIRSDSAGPDFSIQDPIVHVEAIAPEPSESIRTAARALRSTFEFVDIPQEEIIFRFTAAIAEKRRKYTEWLIKERLAPDEPFIVAVSGAKFGPAILDPEHPLIFYPLFGFAAQTATFAPESHEVTVQFEPGLRRTKPATGAQIDNFLFREFESPGSSAAATEVSAVIFSDSNFRTRSPGCFDDLIVIHNPAAMRPVPEGLLPFGQEYAARGNEIVSIHDYRTPS